MGLEKRFQILEVVAKGGFNSRMKDFHDLFLMSRNKGLLAPARLSEGIRATFAHHETGLRLPLDFKPGEYATVQAHWARHLSGLEDQGTALSLPLQFQLVVLEINCFLRRTGKLEFDPGERRNPFNRLESKAIGGGC